MTYDDIKKVNDEIVPFMVEKKNKKTGRTEQKPYAKVSERVTAFRKLYPEGSIIPELVSLKDGVCVFKATVSDNEGTILAQAHAEEEQSNGYINKTSFVENCESSAVGRALGMLGIGIDTGIASAEEVVSAGDNDLSIHNIFAIKERVQTAYTALLNNGLSTDDIARALGLSKGKVKEIFTYFDLLGNFERDLLNLR